MRTSYPYPGTRSPSARPTDGILDEFAIGRVEVGARAVAELNVDDA